MSSARRHGLVLAFAAAFGLVVSGVRRQRAPHHPAAEPPPAKVPLRRLTNAEYAATVADLFPGYTLPEMVFTPDAKVLGLPEHLQLADRQPGPHGAVRDGGAGDRGGGDRRSDGADRLRRRGAGAG